MPKRVVVALSGGVDSSVAALLLKRSGFDVIGITLKTWPKELCNTVPKGQTCCSTRDIEDAKAVCAQLGIPFYVVEASEVFQSQVMDLFLEGYAQGLTPNPCVVCNRQIKCGILWQRAQALGADFLATGHYARVSFDSESGRYILRQAVDEKKDQSYVLFQLSQEILSHLLLPIGDLPKPKVRELALAAGLRVAEKPESMELCFIPDGDTQGFLKARVPDGFQPGEIMDRRGQVLGTHQGIAAYTIGQRKGLRVAHPKPLYVLELDPTNNRVIVGEEDELKVTSCFVKDLYWVAIPSLEERRKAFVKIRYRSDKQRATMIPEGKSLRVEFDEPVEGGMSPGQAAVFYDDDVVLGGGWIARERSAHGGQDTGVSRQLTTLEPILQWLNGRGFPDAQLEAEEDLLILKLPPDKRAQLLASADLREQLTAHAKGLGFTRITLDLS